MKKEEYISYCKTIPGVTVDCPFRQDRSPMVSATIIARHTDSRKWFAAIMEQEERTFVNLKCRPDDTYFLRSAFEGITPAYHMNKEHWNSVRLQSDVPDDLIRQLTMDSFALTRS